MAARSRHRPYTTTPPPSQPQARPLIRTRPTRQMQKRQTGYRPAAHPRRIDIPPQRSRTHPGQRSPETSTALTRHFTLPATHPYDPTPPPATTRHATGRWQQSKIPTKSPQNTGLRCLTSNACRPIRSRHLRWSGARFVSSRDRTRTYNLPVNRRSVIAGDRGCLRCCRPV